MRTRPSPSRRTKEVSAESRAQYEQLDALVDERSTYRNMLRDGAYNGDPILEEQAKLAIQELNEQILVRLEPYLAKFILLLTGRLPVRSWNADTYRFLYLLSGKKDNTPEAHMEALNWVKRVIAEHLRPDVEDATITDDEFHRGESADAIQLMSSAQVRSAPIYTELVTITLDICNTYKVIHKEHNNERINFIHAFMTQFKYKLKQWITSQAKDVMNFCFRVQVETDETDDGQQRKTRPRTLDTIKGESFDRPVAGVSFTTFEEFLATTNEPWRRLTALQKELMWNKTILRMKPEDISEEMGMPKNLVAQELESAKETIRQACTKCPQLRNKVKGSVQVFS